MGDEVFVGDFGRRRGLNVVADLGVVGRSNGLGVRKMGFWWFNRMDTSC